MRCCATNKQDKIKFMASGKEYEVVEVGFMTPEKKTVDVLRAGEVGRLDRQSRHEARFG